MTEMSTNENTIHKEPLKHIGARELLQFGYSYASTIRKEGRMDREIRKRFPKSDKLWKRFYVVLSRGCVYIYSDDSSKSAKKSLSLRLFSRVEPFSREPTAFRFCFRVLPSERSGLQPLCFSCTDASNRENWVKRFEDEILRTRDPKSMEQSSTHCGYPDDQEVLDSYDVINLEDMIENKTNSPARYTPLPTQDSKRKSLRTRKSDETQKATEIKRSVSNPHMPIDQSNEQRKYCNVDSDEESEEYDDVIVGVHNIEDVSIYQGPPNSARNLVSQAEPGTFLIRPAKQFSEEIPYALVVQTATGPTQSHIHQLDNDVYLSESHKFPSLSQLVEFYQSTALPNQSKLKLKNQITS